MYPENLLPYRRDQTMVGRMINELNSMSLRPGATADCKSGVQETLNDAPGFFPSLSYTTFILIVA